MKLIVAVNNLGVIGNEGTIPWRCKADMKHFKTLTTGGTVIMGSGTYISMGSKPLPNRNNVVLSTWLSKDIEGITVIRGILSTLDYITNLEDKNVWIIGGSYVYKNFVDICDEIHISRINNDSSGDRFFEIPEEYKGKVFNYNFDED